MQIKKIVSAGIAALVLAGAAQANVTTIGSQAAFNAAGTVSQNTNFDSWGSGFFYPANTYTVGAETFVAGAQNLIGGTGTSYNLGRNLITDNNVAGTTVDLTGQYNLFAVDAGNFYGQNAENIVVTTNLGSYSFAPIVSTAANGGALTFLGFEAGAGEYFQSIAFSGPGATGVTDVQIGVSSVPEASSSSLMLLGLAGIGAMLRSRRQRNAA